MEIQLQLCLWWFWQLHGDATDLARFWGTAGARRWSLNDYIDVFAYTNATRWIFVYWVCRSWSLRACLIWDLKKRILACATFVMLPPLWLGMFLLCYACLRLELECTTAVKATECFLNNDCGSFQKPVKKSILMFWWKKETVYYSQLSCRRST